MKSTAITSLIAYIYINVEYTTCLRSTAGEGTSSFMFSLVIYVFHIEFKLYNVKKLFYAHA